jgi:hypothetical protein
LAGSVSQEAAATGSIKLYPKFALSYEFIKFCLEFDCKSFNINIDLTDCEPSQHVNAYDFEFPS